MIEGNDLLGQKLHPKLKFLVMAELYFSATFGQNI